MKKIVTAAMLAIGDELLSGRTKDKNIGYLADFLTLKGIDLKQVRIVGDEEEDIIEAINALRNKYDYVFTSGGIGPTHDDITADAIAKAFGVEIGHDPRAMKLLGEHYRRLDIEFTQARQRMARIPANATLIDNPVSVAPGFIVENVHVMAGVPAVFQAMLDAIEPNLKTGAKILSKSIDSPLPEGAIGTSLGDIQEKHRETSIGSYPRFDGKKLTNQIVIRSRNKVALKAAEKDVLIMLEKLKPPAP